EAGAVWTDELAGDELIARLRAQRGVPVRRVRVAEVGQDLIPPADQRHAAVKIWNPDRALPLVKVARQPESGHEIDRGAVERETLQPVVAPVGDHEDRSPGARVDPQAVRLVQ